MCLFVFIKNKLMHNFHNQKSNLPSYITQFNISLRWFVKQALRNITNAISSELFELR